MKTARDVVQLVRTLPSRQRPRVRVSLPRAISSHDGQPCPASNVRQPILLLVLREPCLGARGDGANRRTRPRALELELSRPLSSNLFANAGRPTTAACYFFDS